MCVGQLKCLRQWLVIEVDIQSLGLAQKRVNVQWSKFGVN